MVPAFCNSIFDNSAPGVRFYMQITFCFLRFGRFRPHFRKIPLLYYRNYVLGGLPRMRSAISRNFKWSRHLNRCRIIFVISECHMTHIASKLTPRDTRDQWDRSLHFNFAIWYRLGQIRIAKAFSHIFFTRFAMHFVLYVNIFARI